MKNVKDEVVVSSTGMISREVYKYKDRDLNFYMMGSMGMALAIGIGIALRRKDLKVIVINGDGSALMSMGTFALHKWCYFNKDMKNLRHYILDNNVHATTGGQKTASDMVVFDDLAPETYTIQVLPGKGDAPRIPLRPCRISERFKNAILCKQIK
jgi:thiamine pyrophosphate-dependent acetolactate synthase large subunit-like protein